MHKTPIMIAAVFWVSLMVGVPLPGTPQSHQQDQKKADSPPPAAPKSGELVAPSLGTTAQEDPATRLRNDALRRVQFDRAEHFHVQNINAQVIERCLAVARDIDPQLADRLSLLRKKDPPRFSQQMKRLGKRLVSLADLRERDSDLYKLKIFEMQTESEARRVARECRVARDSGKTRHADELELRLRALLSALTVFSLKAREDYLCRLQDHVLKLEKDLARDRLRMEELTEDRLQHMLYGSRKTSPAKTLRPSNRKRNDPPSTTQPQSAVGEEDRDG